MTDCNCFVARHPQAAEIDAALGRDEDPRAVAKRYGIGKTKVYEHRRHLLGEAPARPVAPGAPQAPAGPEAPARGEGSAVPPEAREEAGTAPQQPPPGGAEADAERSAEQAPPPAESAERRAEPCGTGVPPSVPAAAGPVRARPAPREGDATRSVPPSGYIQAVDACLGLISESRWRPAHVRGLAERYGISVDRARHAYHEATRHLQLDMGGYVQKQATSAAWTMRQRDDARARAESASTNAERWRRQEREAQEAADKLPAGKERFAMLETAARFGLLAAKYGQEAEKWSAQALAHQRHLDDVLCLRAPKEMHLTQNNIGVDSAELVDRLAEALCHRFADRPAILAEIEETAASIEAGSDVPLLNEASAA